MINKLYVIESETFLPYHNQALEEYLLDNVNQESLILYLWQNRNTVVIGKNQNPFNECDVKRLEEDDGYLARRLSGGGAVYHDLGNLNFTFLSAKNNYDVERQNKVILDAINKLGIKAEKNGRNDLTIEGRKFSGHAYYSSKYNCYHHGTIMYDVDEDALSRYLKVSLLKLKDKAVTSVRSRVINLKQIRNDIDIDDIKKVLVESLEENYQIDSIRLKESDLDKNRIDELERKYGDPVWKYGKQKEYENVIEKKFDFGIVKIEYSLTGNIIDDLVIYTDSLFTTNIEELIDLLKGKDISLLDTDNPDQIQKQIIDFMKEEIKCTM